MTKQEMLAFISGLPDDAEVLPLELSECSQDFGNWESKGYSDSYGGVYERSIEQTVVFRVNYKTKVAGSFRRTYENQEGMFYNLRSVYD